ncbi:response regulator [Chitinophaga sancti]|uniref:response regulator n=1 Tax=Chitinophaga sancti TaxID=1004 RepID=UPI002A74F39D|nr:response regulator [Chitinophaga sancti]WPQ61614.1 response regulator [Chitinophaga sancti]
MKQQQTVLIIDDDADDRLFLTEAITDVVPGSRMHSCNSGIEALDLLSKKKIALPDFIFLDLNMPKMNGKECLVELKGLLRQTFTKIIIMSTSDMKRDIDDALKLGAHVFFTKPGTYTELCNHVKKIFYCKSAPLSFELK